MSTDVMTCISCGMPMRTDEEHCLGDASKEFCRFCGTDDGNLKSYDEVLVGMTAFMTGTQGLDESVAREAAKGMLANMPAWKDR